MKAEDEQYDKTYWRQLHGPILTVGTVIVVSDSEEEEEDTLKEEVAGVLTCIISTVVEIELRGHGMYLHTSLPSQDWED